MEEEEVGPLDGFVFEKNKDGTFSKQIVICKHCLKKFSFHRSCTTLKYHLNAKHPLVGASDSLRQSTLDERRGVSKSTSDKLTSTIAKWVSMNCRPISIVEDEGLAEVLQVATHDTTYKPPARSTVMLRVHALYTTEKVKKEEAIAEAKHVALTGDHWTSVSNKNYLGVTAHHITEAWGLQSFALTVMKTEQRHFAEACAEQFQTVARKWEIEKKVTTIGTDSARNMVAAGRILPYEHIPCVAHIIQRSITVSLADSGFVGTLTKCRKIVGHFKHSPANAAELTAQQRSLELKEEALVQDVATRWNSTLDMIQRLNKNKAAVIATLDEQNHKLAMLTDAEWDKLKKLETLLEPCRYVTVLLGGETYVSCSVVLPALCHLHRKMAVTDEDPAYVVRFKEKMQEDLASRQIDMNNDWFRIATALDPRFKNLKSVPKAEREAVWTALGRLLCEKSTPSPPHTDEDGPPKKKKSLLLEMDSSSESEEEAQPDSAAIHRYRAEPTISMESCPLEWWASHSGAHAKLALLARKYLATPATSVPCERLFSVAGNVVNKKRAALLSENVDKLVCLSSWLKKKK